jgi:hypothetical protein
MKGISAWALAAALVGMALAGAGCFERSVEDANPGLRARPDVMPAWTEAATRP